MTFSSMILPEVFVSLTPSVLFVAIASLCRFVTSRRKAESTKREQQVAYEAMVGNTPLIKLTNISRLVGRDIYVKVR